MQARHGRRVPNHRGFVTVAIESDRLLDQTMERPQSVLDTLLYAARWPGKFCLPLDWLGFHILGQANAATALQAYPALSAEAPIYGPSR